MIQTLQPLLGGVSLKPPLGGISRQGEGLMGWWMAYFYAIFGRRVEWVLFSEPQTHVQVVKIAISSAVAVIHCLTHMYFEGSVAALGLTPQKI